MERIRYLGELMGTSQQPQVLLDACTALPPTEPNNESHSPQSIPGAEEEPGGSAEEEAMASFDDSASAFSNSSIADNSLESTSAVRPSKKSNWRRRRAAFAIDRAAASSASRACLRSFSFSESRRPTAKKLASNENKEHTKNEQSEFISTESQTRPRLTQWAQ